MHSHEFYQCQICGNAGRDPFVSIFNNERFCAACGKKLTQSASKQSQSGLRKKGRPKTVNKKIIRSVRFDDDEWSLIQAAAAKKGLNISNFIRKHLRTIAADVLHEQ
jgi:Mobilization protein NikA